MAVEGMPCNHCRSRVVKYGTRCELRNPESRPSLMIIFSGNCEPGPGDACLPCNAKHYSCVKRDDAFAANPEARRTWRQFAEFVDVGRTRAVPECFVNHVQRSVDDQNSHITDPGTRGRDPAYPNKGTYPKFSGRVPSRARVSVLC